MANNFHWEIFCHIQIRRYIWNTRNTNYVREYFAYPGKYSAVPELYQLLTGNMDGEKWGTLVSVTARVHKHFWYTKNDDSVLSSSTVGTIPLFIFMFVRDESFLTTKPIVNG